MHPIPETQIWKKFYHSLCRIIPQYPDIHILAYIVKYEVVTSQYDQVWIYISLIMNYAYVVVLNFKIDKTRIPKKQLQCLDC